MADTRRQAAAQELPHRSRGHPARNQAAKVPGPYAGGTVGAYCGRVSLKPGPLRYIARRLGLAAATVQLCDLAPIHVAAVEGSYAGLARATRYGYARKLRQLLRGLAAVGAPDLSGLVARVAVPQPRTVRPTADEIQRILAVDDLPLRWVVTCGVDLGLRRGTSEALTPRHLATGEILTATKRGTVIRLPITPRIAALAQLARASEDDADLRYIDLLNHRRTQGPQTLIARWRAWKARVGLPANLRPHDLRRDFAHRAYGACGDIRQVQGAMGHQTPVTTLRYLHLLHPTATPATIAASLVVLKGQP